MPEHWIYGMEIQRWQDGHGEPAQLGILRIAAVWRKVISQMA
jgi:hypothetical protein